MWKASATRAGTSSDVMTRKDPASGPERATTLALFGLALATATPHGLTSRHTTDSQAHSSKGTPPPPHNKHVQKALTACKRPVSGTISLPSRGTFHHSLTVLSTIGHQEVFRQPSGLGRLTQDSTSPVLPREHTHTPPTRFRLQGSHPLRPAIPDGSATQPAQRPPPRRQQETGTPQQPRHRNPNRKSTRLNSSHHRTSYAVFCLKKKINKPKER